MGLRALREIMAGWIGRGRRGCSMRNSNSPGKVWRPDAFPHGNSDPLNSVRPDGH